MRNLLFGIMMLLAQPAFAGPQAEYNRLQEEATKLAARNAWKGVDRVYVQLTVLAEKGIPLSYSDHMMGATASKSLGSVNDTWTRVTAANEMDPTIQSFEMLAVIFANYGPVSLRIKKNWEGDTELVAKDLGFNPEQQRVVQQARKDLEEERNYAGLLPLGRYVLGDKKFDIVGGPLVEVLLKKEPKYVLPESGN